jgi:hypothetical protein
VGGGDGNYGNYIMNTATDVRREFVDYASVSFLRSLDLLRLIKYIF